MKYLLTFIIAALFLPVCVHAQEKLNKMVEERQVLHQQWRNAENQKSGIFGNRTKKDMMATNTWLEKIIQKDNQIIEELELIKKIETAEIGFEKEDYKFIAQKQEQDIGILKRALAEKDKDIVAAKSQKRTYEWISFLLFLSTLGLGYFYYKGKNITNKKELPY